MKNLSFRVPLMAIAVFVALSSIYLEQVHTVEDSVPENVKSEDFSRKIKVKVDLRRKFQSPPSAALISSTAASTAGSESQDVTRQPSLSVSQQTTAASETSSSTSPPTTSSDQVASPTPADSLHESQISDGDDSRASHPIVGPKSTTRANNPESVSESSSDKARSGVDTASSAPDFTATTSPSEPADNEEVPGSAEFTPNGPPDSDREDNAESGEHEVEQTPDEEPTEYPGQEEPAESTGSNDESQYDYGSSEPIDERVEETYIDDSDPNNPKQVHHVKEIHSSVGPNSESYTQTDSKTSNSIGANSNYHGYSKSKVSSSSSSSYSDSGRNYNTQPGSYGAYGKQGKKHRHRSKHNRPAHSVYNYPLYPAYHLSQPFPAMPPMPKMPRMYPIFPPIPNLPHAPKIPPAWQNLANRGVGYGYAYPPSYAVASGKPSKGGAKKVAYAYAKARSGADPYAQAKKPKKSSKRKRRHSNRRNQNSQDTSVTDTLV